MRIIYLPNQYSQQRQKDKPVWVYPVLLAMEAEYSRRQGHEVLWDVNPEDYPYDKLVSFPEGIPFLSLPAPDRIFTKALDKKYQEYGNYLLTPATHMQVANGCWHGKCTFCVERKNTYEVRHWMDCLKEIAECKRLGFKEIFDDSGTFPDGNWVHKFCINKRRDGLHDVVMGCNLRINSDVDFDLMKRSGFRMALFGIESANQSTLDRINKGVRVENIQSTLKKAVDAGLNPHISFMLGFPWESEKEEANSIALCHLLLRKGLARTAQISTYTPEGEIPCARKPINKLFIVAVYPDFWYSQLKFIRSFEDCLYLVKAIKKAINAISLKT
jgi:radical SAM superfamily enzyme YgiQ (UPF0313 family)